MFRSTRAVVVLCAICGVSVTAIIGWATGFFTRLAGIVGGWWNGLTEWLGSPLTLEHILAGAGVILVPVILLAVIFALTGN